MSLWQRLRDLQDEYETAQQTRPTRCGSEEMARDEAAGNALAALLDVVEAAACYRESQQKMRANPRLSAAHRRRMQQYLDEKLAVLERTTTAGA